MNGICHSWMASLLDWHMPFMNLIGQPGIIKLVPPYSRMAYASRECYYLVNKIYKRRCVLRAPHVTPIITTWRRNSLFWSSQRGSFGQLILYTTVIVTGYCLYSCYCLYNRRWDRRRGLPLCPLSLQINLNRSFTVKCIGVLRYVFTPS